MRAHPIRWLILAIGLLHIMKVTSWEPPGKIMTQSVAADLKLSARLHAALVELARLRWRQVKMVSWRWFHREPNQHQFVTLSLQFVATIVQAIEKTTTNLGLIIILVSTSWLKATILFLHPFPQIMLNFKLNGTQQVCLSIPEARRDCTKRCSPVALVVVVVVCPTMGRLTHSIVSHVEGTQISGSILSTTLQ